ncbi:hypothetical protein [Pseudobacteriovorax antillogorgiicola]|uniref:Uncharacterized protein n=1 Tax=Pseudobacteriovorax antillogorgiicola TaxID=1513793 RepID=A0A1Y6CB10_9BACT|nr:hypothetical protein [Pseudobacteriovorax antillogorgiicola]TCS48673.1 hypothetical protein EDD56_11795 [Pseudobacteriovorax antillogorgiicola]SMF54979.1 hypothetical protein SAMN06296036_11764 [Pseudobacteriovorax antillogorgiicola]
MKFMGLWLMIGAFSCLSATALGTELKGINPGRDTLVRLPKAPKKVARVRLGVKLVPYKKLVVTDKGGVNRIGFAKTSPLKRNLRSRIERSTHFYIDRWHIELQPKAWDKASMTLKYRVRLYKQYGQSRDLEEQIGYTDVAGILEGSRFVYNFKGTTAIKFKNKSGQPIVELYIQEPFGPARSMDMARFKPSQLKPSK